MSYSPELSPGYGVSAAESPALERAAFIRRVYGHLAGSILAFAGLTALLLAVVPPELILGMFSNWVGMIVIFGIFMVATWTAQSWAHSEVSIGTQYLGLGLCIAAYSVFFLPLLYIAKQFYPGAIETAAIMTFAVFAGLTVAVFTTRRDYSYLAPVLSIGSMLALGFMIAALFFDMGNTMYLVFSFFMVALMCAYIIYETSVIMHHYRTDQHVGASLMLFTSVATLFIWILRIVMASRD